MRLYLLKDKADETKFATKPYRDVYVFRVCGAASYEEEKKSTKNPET